MSNSRSIIVALLTIVATVAFVLYEQQPVAPVQATWDDVITEGEFGGYRIITTEEFVSRYQAQSSQMLLVDTRQEWEYRTGHIAGAVNFPMEPSWWSRISKGRQLETFLGSDKNRTLVFY